MSRFLPEIKNALGAETKSFENPADGMAKIGEWIVKASNGLLDGKGFKLEDKHVLALVDVIAFDGRWEDVFDAGETRQRPFFGSSSQTVQVPMMRRFGKYAYGESDGYQVIRVAVDETETVAAAATELIGEATSAQPLPPFHMEVNRPFYFAIRDNSTGTVHFVGKVVKPE